jgi:hypothetical protein
LNFSQLYENEFEENKIQMNCQLRSDYFSTEKKKKKLWKMAPIRTTDSIDLDDLLMKATEALKQKKDTLQEDKM